MRVGGAHRVARRVLLAAEQSIILIALVTGDRGRKRSARSFARSLTELSDWLSVWEPLCISACVYPCLHFHARRALNCITNANLALEPQCRRFGSARTSAQHVDNRLRRHVFIFICANMLLGGTMGFGTACWELIGLLRIGCQTLNLK
jgi:hypothetical protein